MKNISVNRTLLGFLFVVFCLFLLQCAADEEKKESPTLLTKPIDNIALNALPHVRIDTTPLRGTIKNPIPWDEMWIGEVYYRPDTCVTYVNKNGELAIFLHDHFEFCLWRSGLDELAEEYTDKAKLKYANYQDDDDNDKKHLTSVKIKKSTFEYICDDVEGCFYHLNMVDSLVQVNGMYIGMTKEDYFALYPNKIGLEYSVDNFTYNYDWMLCLKLKFKNNILVSMKTGAL